MDLLKDIQLHKEISETIEKLEEQKKALGLKIMQTMKSMQERTLYVDSYIVRHCSRLSISLCLEDARFHAATKFEEVVDKEKIKTLYKNGTPINGVKEVNYIQVSHKK